MSAREAHQDAIGVALAEIEAFQTLLALAMAKGDEAVLAVARAVGSSGLESASNALNGTVTARDRVPVLRENLEVAAQELRRYGGGF